jgi:hypothetical protein
MAFRNILELCLVLWTYYPTLLLPHQLMTPQEEVGKYCISLAILPLLVLPEDCSSQKRLWLQSELQKTIAFATQSSVYTD